MRIMNRDIALNMGMTEELVSALHEFAVKFPHSEPTVTIIAAFSTALHVAIESGQVSESSVRDILDHLWRVITP